PFHCQRRIGGLDGACGAEEVSGHALGGRDSDVSSEKGTDGMRLDGVVSRRRGAVRIDMADVGGLYARVREGGAHRLKGAPPLRIRRGDVMRIRGGTIADHLGVNARTARARRLFRLQNYYAGPFREYEPVALHVEGARGRHGLYPA